MPWKANSTMSLRLEFIRLAMLETANIRLLCRRFGISPKTGYKWLHRYRSDDPATLQDLSRRPHHSPSRTSGAVEQLILRLRQRHPAWGARKLRARLLAQGQGMLPSVSTMTAILHRNGYINAIESSKHQSYRRFEAAAPNLMWQMDYKGDFAVLSGGRCYPLTIVDDYSRYAVGLYACANQRSDTVQQHLITVFRQHGLPQRLLTDNGGPWGSCGYDAYTVLGVWLIRLGISLSHSRVCHPQTLGKDERFHRSMQAEILAQRVFASLNQCQEVFNQWRMIYNWERPHEALQLAPPASRYQVSPRAFPETLPPIEYGPGDIVRKVDDKGDISFRGKLFRVGKAFHRSPVALRPTVTDGVFDVFFCHQPIAQVNFHNDNHTN